LRLTRRPTIQLYGNTHGLSPQAEKILERLYRKRVASDTIVTAEVMRTLAEATVLTGRQIGLLIHRSGQVDSVIVGDAQRLMLPDVGRLRAAVGRFRGVRLVHTHVRGEALSREDIVDLVRLRLDLVAALHMAPSGEVRSMTYAYNVLNADGGEPYRAVGPLPVGQIQLDVGDLMQNLEAEFAQRTALRDVVAKDGRAILVHVSTDGIGAEASMRELRELARTAGLEVADAFVQTREHLDTRFVVGKGKLDDIILRAMDLDASVLVFDHNLSPAQAREIAKVSDLKVIDRTQLILDIFAQRAESRDGKLQVELAQLRYRLPRLGQKDDALSRLTGGIGGRGPGETKLEIGRRRAKERVSHLEDQLKKLGKQRGERRRKRNRAGIPRVAIVGYTNAGKSTLLTALTGADVLREDKLFATLDTRSRVLRVGWAGHGEREVVVTDTVGFIRNLPKDLFAAFRATFEEATDADLLLHVVDASDAAFEDHLRTTEQVLRTLELDDIPSVLVWNKCELLSELEQRARVRDYAGSVCVSALSRETVRPLIDRVKAELEPRWTLASRGPNLEPDMYDVGIDADAAAPAADDTQSASTLDELLAHSGRRRKRAAHPDSDAGGAK
jgi:GTP-binding protein HflX